MSLTHRCHWVDGYISCAGLQLKRVTRVDVSHRWVRHGSSRTLRLDCVALRGPLGSHRAAVELGFLEISLWTRRRRWGRVVGLGARRGLHVGVLGHVRILRAGEVRRRLHGLTARIIETWEMMMKKKKKKDKKKKSGGRGITNRKSRGRTIKETEDWGLVI